MPSSPAVPQPTAPFDRTTLDARRAALREELETQQAQLAALQATVDELSPQTGSDSVAERGIAERNIARCFEVIADVEQALRRLDDGTYGICEGCRQPIAAARLEAIPYTRHCVSCPAPSPRRPA